MSSNLHIAWARLFVRSLRAAGIDHAVVSPGSRSTPLALAVAESFERVDVVIDERSAGFFALGHARVTGKPSLLVCTSGTAAAHYFPAIIEASQSHVPLVVVTADRPWELSDCAAPQTIDQVGLFGGFVRTFAELGAPDASSTSIRAVVRIAAQVVARSLGPLPGPVHVNARFKKPLDPQPGIEVEPWQGLVDDALAKGVPQVVASTPKLDGVSIAALARRIARAERCIIVAGPAPFADAADRAAVFALAEQLGAPLFAEATSQLRFGPAPKGLVRIGGIDVLFRSAAFQAANRPDLILQLGAPPTSTGFGALANEGVPRVVVAPYGWNDPWSNAEAMILGPVADVAGALLEVLPRRESSAWTEAHAHADAIADAAVEAELAPTELTEGSVARSLVRSCPAGTALVVGNSSPVRDVDLWCRPGGDAIDVLHQRGASGIDGLVAGAAGARRARGSAVALLLGDVSLAHDIGSLALLGGDGVPLVIVVVDNGGGRLFETLPIASRIDATTFDRFYLTRPSIDFEHAARAFGVAYACASTPTDLDAALAAAFARGSSTLVRAVVPPGDAAQRLVRVRAAFDAAFTASIRPRAAEANRPDEGARP